ncbi:MAG: M23 family peptidase [Candidatus Moranbacteria bacterium CG_4_9_14_3_um_filter_40_7]|nr:MAG: peptidase M24 [Candidatus Moranbacteria bacterium CG23_combo_of_CG06-09_8_20_14_all_40_16]PIU81089.1 MAG: M23 family peptidase [Candidatus Moranbacteria bacterium CG06_land_8_20_14_3_00_40_12]PJA87680.1 MAG: M23 family peptidase [Candidatus Moranbacteria bacterium CG_4_9_14_3_um_filter_40_7]
MELKQPSLKSAKNNRKLKFFLGLVLVLILYGFFRWFDFFGENASVLEDIPASQEILKEPEEKIVNYTVAEGDIPAEVFSAQGGWDANDTAALLLAAKDVYDFTHIKIGQNLRFYFNQEEERAKCLEYDRNTESLIIVERNGDDFSAREEKIAYEVSRKIVSATINNFFYMDALEAGISEPTVLAISDILSFDIDFMTEIRQGDQFTVIYEKRARGGKEAPDGKILGAKFINDGTTHYAYYFDNDGQGGYYDVEGRVLERQFLKAPLSYRYISSGFTGARYHPITRTVSAHYQIDYAAAIGTPVVATARGTVVSAGWEGGWGRMIRLRHNNGYATHYGHLSAFAKGVRSGVSVNQGQVIGYVGSTGWSTGPHLDYGMKLNGSPVNPLKLELPKGAPLSADKMEEFEKVKDEFAGFWE